MRVAGLMSAAGRMGLGDEADLQQVATHAAGSLGEMDCGMVNSKLKALDAAVSSYTLKAKKFVVDGFGSDSQESQDAVALLKVGRITLSEGLILADPDNKTSVQRQQKLLAGVGADASDLQPAIFLAMQQALSKKR